MNLCLVKYCHSLSFQNGQYLSELAYELFQLMEVISVGVPKQKEVYEEVLNSSDPNSVQ